MTLKKMILSAAAAAGLALACGSAASAKVVNVGTYPSPTQTAYLYLTSGTPFSSSITANFGDTISGSSTAFDDSFDFTIPQNGMGSGSLSTSFSSISNEMVITAVKIDGISYAVTTTASGQSLTVNDIDIKSGVLNTIEVIGHDVAGASAATFNGTATFTAVSAAPEPAAWMLMIAGVGMVGLVARRRQSGMQFA